MRNFLQLLFLFISPGLFSQPKFNVSVMSPKPSITIDGINCPIGNTIYSCTPKTCDSLIITEGDSVQFCTNNEIYLMIDTNYYMQWDFAGSSNYPITFYDSFPTPTPVCYYPKWTVAGNYAVNTFYNGWLSAYPTSDCWIQGPSHWIISITVLPNLGINQNSNSQNFSCEVFPNPGNGIFELKISEPELVQEIFVNDILGKEINIPLSENKIDLTNAPPGIYFLYLKTGNGFLVKKLVKE